MNQEIDKLKERLKVRESQLARRKTLAGALGMARRVAHLRTKIELLERDGCGCIECVVRNHEEEMGN